MIRKLIFLACILSVVLVGLMDYLTGFEMAFGPFYFIPILGAAFFIGMFGSMTMVVLCALTCCLVDRYGGHTYSSPWLQYWNLGMRSLTFLVVGLLASLFGHLLGLATREEVQGAKRPGSIRTVFSAAMDFIARCRRGYPLTGKEYEKDGEMLMARAQYTEALDHFNQAIAKNPTKASFYCHRGTAQSALGRYEEALVDFDRALKLDPQYAWASYKRAFVLDKLGRHEKICNEKHDA
ncbi:MAG: tetratricopeptide repeat protein [Kiritimatiellia bacterium]